MASNGELDFVERFYKMRDGKMRIVNWQNVRFNTMSGWMCNAGDIKLTDTATGTHTLANAEFDGLSEWNESCWSDVNNIKIHEFPELPYLGE